VTAAHVPVMLDSVVEALRPTPTGRFVDTTLGLGGHAQAVLSQLGPEGRLVGLDRDASMLAHAEQRLGPFGDRFIAVRARLGYVGDVVRGLDLAPVDGVLLDLGLCSGQLDDPDRGFSFRAADAPLDMRMNRSHGENAAELLERVELDDLIAILRNGDVPFPRRVARALIERRPLHTVGELLELLRALPLPRRRHHFATLVFQALRMEVNHEAQELETGLRSALELLRPGGRLVVLSYHSGEDRRVKQFMVREARGCICPPALPTCGCGRLPRLRTVAKARAPRPSEVEQNPRARSARLRVAERL